MIEPLYLAGMTKYTIGMVAYSHTSRESLLISSERRTLALRSAKKSCDPLFWLSYC